MLFTTNMFNHNVILTQQRLSKIILFAMCGLTFYGCATRLENEPIDGPWAAPGVQVRQVTRTDMPFYSPLPEHVTYWINAKGEREEAYKHFDSSVRYLDELGYFDRWPKTRVYYNNYNQRLAPFTFHLIAISPTVVVMVPHEYQTESIGRDPGQSYETKYMLNPIQFGTSIPSQTNLLWFSPDLRVPPMPVTRISDSEQRIVHPKIKLLFSKEGDIWRTKRE